MKVTLIRHFQTPGNLLGKYIGSTDEDLVERISPIHREIYPEAEVVYSSPLKRCIQTAELIYPGHVPVIKEQLKECDFGKFENKNYQELSSEPTYQEWINCEGKIPFPEGEDPCVFQRRCKKEFEEIIKDCFKEKRQAIALVVHGGTIMSIMHGYEKEQLGFYEYQVKNGQGYLVELQEEEWNQENPFFSIVRKIEDK